ncbi:MAG TPA: condensation domain-containing protein [Myxococcaceae bacterium]
MEGEAGSLPGRRAGPLSYAQELLWQLDRQAPGTRALNMSYAVALEGALDAEAFAEAFRRLVDRHEPLRTRYRLVDGAPRAEVDPDARVELHRYDLRPLAAEARHAYLVWLDSLICGQPFHLDAGGLIRSALVRLTDTRWAWLLSLHHICADAWSMAVLCKDLSAYYQALTSRREPQLEPLRTQCLEHAAEQRRWLSGPEAQEQLGQWRRHLSEPPLVPLAVPTDAPRHSGEYAETSAQTQALAPGLVQRLRAAAVRERVSPFMILVAAVKRLLARWTGQRDILVGTLIANRTRPGSDRILGAHYNTVLLRTPVSAEVPAQELLRRVEHTCLSAYELQGVPVAQVAGLLQRELGIPPESLVRVMVEMGAHPLARLKLDGVQVGELNAEAPKVVRTRTAGSGDLAFHARERDGAIELSVRYKSELFADSTAASLLGGLTAGLEELLHQLDVPASEMGRASGFNAVPPDSTRGESTMAQDRSKGSGQPPSTPTATAEVDPRTAVLLAAARRFAAAQPPNTLVPPHMAAAAQLAFAQLAASQLSSCLAPAEGVQNDVTALATQLHTAHLHAVQLLTVLSSTSLASTEQITGAQTAAAQLVGLLAQPPQASTPEAVGKLLAEARPVAEQLLSRIVSATQAAGSAQGAVSFQAASAPPAAAAPPVFGAAGGAQQSLAAHFAASPPTIATAIPQSASAHLAASPAAATTAQQSLAAHFAASPPMVAAAVPQGVAAHLAASPAAAATAHQSLAAHFAASPAMMAAAVPQGVASHLAASPAAAASINQGLTAHFAVSPAMTAATVPQGVAAHLAASPAAVASAPQSLAAHFAASPALSAATVPQSVAGHLTASPAAQVSAQQSLAAHFAASPALALAAIPQSVGAHLAASPAAMASARQDLNAHFSASPPMATSAIGQSVAAHLAASPAIGVAPAIPPLTGPIF